MKTRAAKLQCRRRFRCKSPP